MLGRKLPKTPTFRRAAMVRKLDELVHAPRMNASTRTLCTQYAVKELGASADKEEIRKLSESIRNSLNHYQSMSPEEQLYHRGNALLSFEQESALVAWVLSCDGLSMPLRRCDVEENVRRLLGRQDSELPRSWFDGFMRRHSRELKYLHPKIISADRVSEDQIPAVQQFCVQLKTDCRTPSTPPMPF